MSIVYCITPVLLECKVRTSVSRVSVCVLSSCPWQQGCFVKFVRSALPCTTYLPSCVFYDAWCFMMHVSF